jgi:hypothetical protein
MKSEGMTEIKSEAPSARGKIESAANTSGFDPNTRADVAHTNGWLFDSWRPCFDPNVRAPAPDCVENSTGMKMPTIGEVHEWLNEINPNYDPYKPAYCMNCGSCALAVYERLSGKTDAVASPHTLSDAEMEKATGKRLVEMSPGEIVDKLKEQGPGSFAVIGIDRFFGPGHWFVAYCPDGKHTYALDGQTGEIRGWPPDYGNIRDWEMTV